MIAADRERRHVPCGAMRGVGTPRVQLLAAQRCTRGVAQAARVLGIRKRTWPSLSGRKAALPWQGRAGVTPVFLSQCLYHSRPFSVCSFAKDFSGARLRGTSGNKHHVCNDTHSLTKQLCGSPLLLILILASRCIWPKLGAPPLLRVRLEPPAMISDYFAQSQPQALGAQPPATTSVIGHLCTKHEKQGAGANALGVAL